MKTKMVVFQIDKVKMRSGAVTVTLLVAKHRATKTGIQDRFCSISIWLVVGMVTDPGI